MPKIHRKAKRIHKIKFADGQIFTIFDVEPNPQTGMVTLFMRKNVGVEVLLIPIIIGGGMFLGMMAMGQLGLLFGAAIAGAGGLAVVKFTNIGSHEIKRELPEGSIIGFDNFYQLKSKSFCFCCHTFDSKGNQVMPGSDPIAIMSRRQEELEWVIKFMRDEIATLRFNLSESQKTGKELIEETASGLKKLIDSSVGTVRQREPRRYPYGYPSEYPTEQQPVEEVE